MEELLNKYKNHSTPPVPEGYFESLPDQVLSRIADEDAQTSAMLEAHRNNNHYPVPDGYFDALPDEVSKRIAAKSRRPLFLRRFARIAAVAACAGLLMGTGIYVFNMLNSPETVADSNLAHAKRTPPTPVNTQTKTLDVDNALAQSTTPTPKPKSTSSPKTTPSTDPTTDKFISENLNENELNELDYEILDFYSDDMASYDLWGF